jgi:hypothetical protein
MNSLLKTEKHGLQLTHVLCLAAARTPVRGRCRNHVVRATDNVCTSHYVRR